MIINIKELYLFQQKSENDLLNQNKKIEAIKYIVEHCNTGLKDTKDFVDNYDSDNIELNADLNFPKKEGVQIKTKHFF